MFEDCYGRVVIPEANKLGLIQGFRGFCNHGHGPFDNERAALCYCVCHAPMHYASFQAALDKAFDGRFSVRSLPRFPLVVDLGCGPATTLFALSDWLAERKARVDARYLGIDLSEPLLDIAKKLLDDENANARSHEYVLRRSVDQVRRDDGDISLLVDGCDGVLFAMSYVVHQDFMRDMRLLADLIQRIQRIIGHGPAWFMLQDANYADRPDNVTEIWPEDRMRLLATLCRGNGYRIPIHKTTLSAPHLTITADGRFVNPLVPKTQNVCYFFDRLS